MDIFKFINPTAPTRMEQASIINGLSSKMWIERYGKEGEFTFVAPADSGMKETLPIGSFVSHIDTKDIMVVENHEINDDGSAAPNITITGRGFETIFEGRVIGSNRAFPVSETIVDYDLPADFSWNQAVSLINAHILEDVLVDPGNAIPFVTALSDVGVFTGSPASIERTQKRDTLYAGLLSLLAIDNLGVTVIRPGPWSPINPASPNIAVVVHMGVDRSNTVVFSYDTGEILTADYLWTNKGFRNAALVTGKWVETVVIPPGVGIDRRMMYITATDIDQNFTEPPVGSDLDAVVLEMQRRAIDILASQKNVTITKAEIAKKAVKSIYRKDFNVGDIITVMGDYNQVSKMRITEYVEIEDSTGESGYPTLALD